MLMKGRHPTVDLGHCGEILLIAARSHDFRVQGEGAVEQAIASAGFPNW